MRSGSMWPIPSHVRTEHVGVSATRQGLHQAPSAVSCFGYVCTINTCMDDKQAWNYLICAPVWGQQGSRRCRGYDRQQCTHEIHALTPSQQPDCKIPRNYAKYQGIRYTISGCTPVIPHTLDTYPLRPFLSDACRRYATSSFLFTLDP